MRVEATMIQRTFGTAETSKSTLSTEWNSWKRLLRKKYRDRTAIGVLMAFFQRMSFPVRQCQPYYKNIYRMERDQCAVVLRSNFGQEHWTLWRQCNAASLGRNWYCSIHCSLASNSVHRRMGYVSCNLFLCCALIIYPR